MNRVSNPTILDKCQDGDTPGASQRPMPVTFFPPREIANVLADRTGSTVVQVIGKKIVLYKPAKNEKDLYEIELP